MAVKSLEGGSALRFRDMLTNLTESTTESESTRVASVTELRSKIPVERE